MKSNSMTHIKFTPFFPPGFTANQGSLSKRIPDNPIRIRQGLTTKSSEQEPSTSYIPHAVIESSKQRAPTHVRPGNPGAFRPISKIFFEPEIKLDQIQPLFNDILNIPPNEDSTPKSNHLYDTILLGDSAALLTELITFIQTRATSFHNGFNTYKPHTERLILIIRDLALDQPQIFTHDHQEFLLQHSSRDIRFITPIYFLDGPTKQEVPSNQISDSDHQKYFRASEFWRKGDFFNAIILYSELKEVFTATYGETSLQMVVLHSAFASLYKSRSDFAATMGREEDGLEAYYNQFSLQAAKIAGDTIKQILPPWSYYTQKTLFILAHSHFLQGEVDQAEMYHHQILKEQIPGKQLNLIQAKVYLNSSMIQYNRLVEINENRLKALKKRETLVSANSSSHLIKRIDSLINRLTMQMDSYETSLYDAKKALEAFKSIYKNPKHKLIRKTENIVGVYCILLGHKYDAAIHLENALKSLAGVNDIIEIEGVISNICTAFQNVGRSHDIVKTLREYTSYLVTEISSTKNKIEALHRSGGATNKDIRYSNSLSLAAIRALGTLDDYLTILLKSNQLELALAISEETESIVDILNHESKHNMMASAYLKLVKIHAAQGNREKAIHYANAITELRSQGELTSDLSKHADNVFAMLAEVYCSLAKNYIKAAQIPKALELTHAARIIITAKDAKNKKLLSLIAEIELTIMSQSKQPDFDN